MTDNDLRGCLDGTALWAWNQATQVHVRLGRAPWAGTPKYGEVEIFRVLQRWDGIRLPGGASALACRLELHVEEPPTFPVRLGLYAVRRDWGPGEGGIHGNNVSPPRRGEVWWRAARHEIEDWGLPGAGYASDVDPEADTPVSPLAQAVCEPESGSVCFASSGLAEYASERIGAGRPLLFLLKVADAQEDVPGAFLALYSGEHGDSRNTARRPRLVLEWEADGEIAVVDDWIDLEHGRERELPRFPVPPGARLVASFASAPGYDPPLLEVRTGTGDRAGSWRRIGHGIDADGDWAQVRVRALENPVRLGDAFTAELTDTWVVSGPAEDQVVPWLFTSPTGVEHTARATYEGGYRWSVRFVPDEPGAWRYRWSCRFFRAPIESAPGRFDVVGGDAAAIGARLEALAGEAERARAARDGTEAQRLRIVFSRLERLAMALETPATFRSAGGPALADALRRARSALWGKPMPDPIPVESHPVVTELAGRRLRDPIPDGRSHGLGPDAAAERPSRLRRGLTRLLFGLARLNGRRVRERGPSDTPKPENRSGRAIG